MHKRPCVQLKSGFFFISWEHYLYLSLCVSISFIFSFMHNMTGRNIMVELW